MIATKKIPCNELGYAIGEGHHHCTIPDSIVKLMRDLHEHECVGERDIAERLRLPIGTVRKIIYYQRRAQVPRQWREVDVVVPPGVTLAPSAVQVTEVSEVFGSAGTRKLESGKMPVPEVGDRDG